MADTKKDFDQHPAMRPVDRILERAEKVRKTNSGWLISCPVPGHGKGRGDRDPSVSVGLGREGNFLLKCFAGCDTESVVSALGLEMADLFEHQNGSGGGGASILSKCYETAKPCTLEAYARKTGLPIGYLQKLGLSDFHYMNTPAVRILYRKEDGSEAAVRFRIALEKSPEGDNRFRWRKGSKPCLYGLWRLEQAKEAGYVVLVEGESDCHTLWHHGFPALGIPGATNWRNEWVGHLDGIEKVYVVVEPDAAGESLWERLSASPIRERLYRVAAANHKDASELHLADREQFRDRFEAALESAVAWLDIAETEERERAREARAKCEGLARESRILDAFAEDLKLCGVAGEARVGQILYLALNSRHLATKQLVNVVVKGPSSAGKSFVVEKVLGFFPEDAYHFLTSMSERALAYSEESLAHRFLVLAEAAGMSGEFATYLIRSLLSEGRLRYETVEKTAEGMRPRLIEREGPTGLIVTTTRIRLHGENETRMLTVRIDDSPDHTREILEALADEDAEPVDTERWHALQTWITTGETGVTIPYAKKLAQEIPTVAVRLRRDFGAILNLIRSHALLHRAVRERDKRGRIIATVEDYKVVRELVADLISEGVEATVPKTVRETVEAVARLTDDSDGTPVTMVQVGRELKLDKNATYQRVQRALDGGYLKNLEERQGRPYQLVVGDSMPEDQPILPEPKRLQGFTVSGISERVHHPPPPSRATDSRRLTADEVLQVKLMIREGIEPHLARAKVLGLDAPEEKHFGSDDQGNAG
jgi:hypothetical protein